MDKSPDAFRTISEVATELDLPQHVLRFWETRFSQIKPMKRGGGRRYYRPEDVDLLCGIRHLLYGEGYTIKGVQRILKEQGVRYVMDIWQEAELALAEAGPGAPSQGALADADAPVPAASSERPDASHEIAADAEHHDGAHHGERGDVSEVVLDRRVEPRVAETPKKQSDRPVPEKPAPETRSPEIRSPEVRAAEVRADRSPEESAAVMSKAPRAPERPAVDASRDLNGDDDEPMPRDVLADDPDEDIGPPVSRSSFSFMERLRGEGRRDVEPHGGGAQLSKDDIRRLQATLFELLECKRILDQAR